MGQSIAFDGRWVQCDRSTKLVGNVLHSTAAARSYASLIMQCICLSQYFHHMYKSGLYFALAVYCRKFSGVNFLLLSNQTKNIQHQFFFNLWYSHTLWWQLKVPRNLLLHVPLALTAGVILLLPGEVQSLWCVLRLCLATSIHCVWGIHLATQDSKVASQGGWKVKNKKKNATHCRVSLWQYQDTLT